MRKKKRKLVGRTLHTQNLWRKKLYSKDEMANPDGLKKGKQVGGQPLFYDTGEKIKAD